MAIFVLGGFLFGATQLHTEAMSFHLIPTDRKKEWNFFHQLTNLVGTRTLVTLCDVLFFTLLAHWLIR